MQLSGFVALPSFRFYLLARLLERHNERWYQSQFGLSLPEVRGIAITGSVRQLTLKRLCQEADLDRSQGSRLVTRLVERGLLMRLDHPKDQRSALLTLTPRGEKLFPELLAAAKQRNESWLVVLPREVRETFMQQVELIINQLGSEFEMLPRSEFEATEENEAEANIAQTVTIDTEVARKLRDLLSAVLGERSD